MKKIATLLGVLPTTLVTATSVPVATVANAPKLTTTVSKSAISTNADIVIPASTTEVKDYAYFNNTGATLSFAGTNCTKIGNSAFASCKNLTTITLPSSITQISNCAFMGCEAVTTIDATALTAIPTFGGISVFRGVPSTAALKIDQTKVSASDIFSAFINAGLPAGCTLQDKDGTAIELTELALPTSFLQCSKVTSSNEDTLAISGINSKLCPDPTKFTKIVVPATIHGLKVTHISDEAFKDKTSLTVIDLSNATNLTTIGTNAFAGTKITTLTLPESITSLSEKALNGISLDTLYVDSSYAANMTSNTARVTTCAPVIYIKNTITVADTSDIKITADTTTTTVDDYVKYTFVSSTLIGGSEQTAPLLEKNVAFALQVMSTSPKQGKAHFRIQFDSTGKGESGETWVYQQFQLTTVFGPSTDVVLENLTVDGTNQYTNEYRTHDTETYCRLDTPVGGKVEAIIDCSSMEDIFVILFQKDAS